MFRLFVALRPPPALRDALIPCKSGLDRVRWQSDDQLHLTLRFIGEVDRHLATDIATALGSVHHPAVTVKLDGLGCFDRDGFIDALWVGVTPHDPVRSLRDAVNRALVRVGIAPERRTFLPHITMARFSRGSAPVMPLPPWLVMPVQAEGHFDSFCLYESDLGAGGSAYTVIERYPLR
jgi:2'-5' RNA ligase